MMKRKPILLGLCDGRITHMSVDTSKAERISFIKGGCDTVVIHSGECPDFNKIYRVEVSEVTA